MKTYRYWILITSAFLLSCADDVVKKSSTPPGFNNTIETNNPESNNSASNNGESNNSETNGTNNTNNTTTDPLNNPDPELCGNGVLDAGEACDPTISSGVGTCPQSCQTQDACL